MSSNDFKTLNLSAPLLSSLDDLGYVRMTPIQEQCLPHVLGKRDLIAQAKTGSGKTAAFALGLLNQIDVTRDKIQGLVLCPTRELADQVGNEIRRLAKFIPNVKVLTLCGGRPLRPQAASLDYGAHIIVGTPGRIDDHLGKETINFDDLKILVLDEADRMLDMGFYEIISSIIQALPKRRQTLLFSATYPDTIKQMSADFQDKPIEVKLASHHSADNIKQGYFVVKNEEDRLLCVKTILSQHEFNSSIVFCTTKVQCDDLVHELQDIGLQALAIHGDLEQRDREEVLVLFANKTCTILVATDVASRGLDIKDVELVLNYQLARSPEIYVHRIGRTGRADSKGQAFSLVTNYEQRRIAEIEAYQKAPIPCEELGKLPKIKTTGKSKMATLKIAGGRKNKISKGDILGALTSSGSTITGSDVGKIDIFDFHSYVAMEEQFCTKALQILNDKPIKGRSFKVKRVF
ncbi:MAG: ATP-dependent RNA helicase DbpA [Oligoflexales bacterium]|nr:ATP-dependent RNA helicase DbpA [Oligoflexales bacterium]